MTEQVTTTELDTLKAQADDMGITYAKNVTAKTLKKLIAQELLKDNEQDNSDEIKQVEDENLKLVHVIVTPVSSQAQAKGFETFMVGNAVLGTISRIVPMGKPWLVENIIYKHIKEREFQLFVERDNPMNPKEKIVDSRLVPAYNIQVLPLPTPDEIEQLKERQKARNAVE